MSKPRYKTVTRTEGNNRALKDGAVKPDSFEFDFEEIPVPVDGFRRMVRGNEFDICEMAVTTYVCARAHGKPFTALPIFLVRGFHHGAIMVNTKAGIASPKDLEGRKVGVSRGYTVTTGVWARSILQREHGVDLSKVTWVLSGDEHVAEYRAPANVVPIAQGKKLADMLIAGELAAAIGVEVDHPDIKPLIPQPQEAGLAQLRANGHYPINHVVVVKDDLLAAHPGLAADVFQTFVRAKQLYLAQLRSGGIENPNKADRMHLKVMEVMADPLPYGIAPNAQILDELLQNAIDQRIIDRAVPLTELFAAGTRDLVG